MTGNPAPTSAERLRTPAQFIKGVGPQRAPLLEKLGLKKARDILFFFPRDYQDMSQLCDIASLEADQPCSVCGVVEEIDLRNIGTGRTMLGVLVRQDTSYLRAIWFNQPFMRQKFQQGARVLLSGVPKISGGRWEMTHPRLENLNETEQAPAGKVLPVYPLTDGVNQSQMRRIVQGVVEEYLDDLQEVFPEDFLESHSVWGIHEALPEIHAPASIESLARARERFIYQELLVLQLALAIRKWRLTHSRQAPPLPATARIDARIRRLFPFDLTEDQNTAIQEIADDMARDRPMNRMLQGDVGSGKTVVAMYAMLTAVAHKKQAVLMAPTEVLARQHARTLFKNLKGSRVRTALLTGSQTPAQRRDLLQQIQAGEFDLITGTHAIANAMRQHHDAFANTGLMVIDEQHKFGVKQRAALKLGEVDPHYLVMTATPIPRTMSMTQFGDLDVSTLSSAPPGRQQVHTYLGDERRRTRWWDFFRKKLREGRQGYIVTPLVEDAGDWNLASVQSSFENLANGELADFRLDLLHGRMETDEKIAAMEAFAAGKTQVLVTTSVIEVGVDIANATLMTIEGGERFGLAQLHQLRGRISRGSHPGYLTVFAEAQTEDAIERLQAFIASNDGFELAEIDFRLRGPGDLFGSRQHGLPPLRIADLNRDAAVLQRARADAQRLIENDPDLADERFSLLRKMVMIRYGAELDLVDVG